MNILSLFGGMECGKVALDKLGIKYKNYYSSEIDKYAIKIAMKNNPDIKQLGDVKNIQVSQLPKIDLLMGGSPCQGFSFAGKQLNFNDPRSKLFFEYVRILEEVKVKNPNVFFLLENVKMKKESRDIISEYLGVQPIEINSSLVSAQNRKRLYWTNIPNVNQPRDKHIHLIDILEKNGVEYIQHNNIKKYFNAIKDNCIYNKDKETARFLRKKEGTLSHYKAISQLCGANNKSKCITTSGQNFSNSGSTNLMYKLSGKIGVRTLSTIECERLQTLPDNYTDGVSKTQRYKMLGNGWTVDVISHILSYINK